MIAIYCYKDLKLWEINHKYLKYKHYQFLIIINFINKKLNVKFHGVQTKSMLTY